MPTILPTDINNLPIPALRLADGGAHAISTSATAARNSTAIGDDTRVISIYATEDVFLKFGGDDSVTADSADHFFPKGIYYDFGIGGRKRGKITHVSAIRASEDGTVYISEKE